MFLCLLFVFFVDIDAEMRNESSGSFVKRLKSFGALNSLHTHSHLVMLYCLFACVRSHRLDAEGGVASATGQNVISRLHVMENCDEVWIVFLLFVSGRSLTLVIVCPCV